MSAAKSSELADRDTPLLRAEWYVAALAHEVTRVPLRRTICEQDIVLYRREDGAVAALQNRCAHRSYPLSNGRLEGDRIVCSYHGMQFTPDGRCALIPSQAHVPAAMRVQAYPVIEQGPFVWLWLGDPDAADPAKFVAQPWFTDAGWAQVTGYLPMAASYLGLHENLLDLSHFAFVHGAAFARPEHAGAELKVEVRADRVHAEVLHEDVGVSPALAAVTNLVRPVNRLSVQDVPTPAIHLGRSITTDASDPPQTITRYIVHYPTPETRTSTHYFWGIAFDVGRDDPAVAAELQALGDTAFAEDRDVLEAIEALVARDVRPDFRERIIASDKGGVLFLRWLAERQRAEAAT